MKKQEYIEKYGEEAYKRYLEKRKQYRKEHKEEIREYNKQYKQQHKEEIRERQKQYQKQYQKQHKEEIRERQKQYKKRYRKIHKEQIKEHRRKKSCMFAYCIPEEIEQIENYELAKADNFKGWHIHHRLETHNSDGEKRLVNLLVEELIALGMYYNRPANELIFLTASEHAKLHQMKR